MLGTIQIKRVVLQVLLEENLRNEVLQKRYGLEFTVFLFTQQSGSPTEACSYVIKTIIPFMLYTGCGYMAV